MADTTTQENTSPEGEENTAGTEEGTDATPEGAESLGDAGKKALDSMKAKWKAEQKRARELEDQLAKATAPAEGEEPTAEAIRAEADKAATARANARIVKAEIKAAAAGKLTDPADALLHLDISEFDVDDNGNVDAEEVAGAIEKLIRDKPYLATATGKRFEGTADQGARPGKATAQLTRDDLKKMTAAEINKARADGRLNKILGIN
ncbi:hypothetical protein ACFORO_42505 [Amycolatopsis halotolerans]|uniref:EF-hand domain-containing protein n=1 Tax=Amycolatopsis halotolerans TaxID=330083 RepID=A0ABV7QXE8_9PSEU